MMPSYFDRLAACFNRPALSYLALGLCIFAFSLWRVMVLVDQPINLSFDEAQYWAWAQTFQWGYYSKPPMVAWAIMATSSVCGEGEACIKLGSVLAHAMAAAGLGWAGIMLFGAPVGLAAALLYLLMPGVSISSMIISTDPFLLAFWAWGLAFAVKALEKNRLIWWGLLGVAIGGGLLAKYAMVFFPLCLMLFLALSPTKRPLLVGRGLWLCLIVAALIYAPNVWWNIENGFVSYLHTRDNANLSGSLFHPLEALEFIGAQFGVFGPLCFAALLFILLTAGKSLKDERLRFLAVFSVPILAIMSLQALLSRANANWAAPALVSACLLVAAWAMGNRRAWIVHASLALHLVAALALYNHDALAARLGPAFSARYDIMKRVRGWDEVGTRLSQILAAHPNHRLMADERKVMASLIYYIRPHPWDAVKWNPDEKIHDHYDQTMALKPETSDLIYVTKQQDVSALAAYFQSVERLDVIHVPIHTDYAITLFVFRVSGFKGY